MQFPAITAHGVSSLSQFDRRGFLTRLAGTSALSLVAGCGAFGGSDEPALPPAGTVGRAALLAPLSGPQATIGQIMREAASLGGNATGPSAEVEVRDSGTTDDTAVQAAQAAVAGGAKMILGPLFSSQCRAVAAAVGRNIPVVALSNDSAIAGGNLFVFGITPLQSARTMLGFAASRGLRRVGVVVPTGAFGERAIVAAQAVSAGFGVTLSAPVVQDSGAGVVDALRTASGGTLPDAVYLPSVSGPFAAQAAALHAAGVQILGSDQWSAIQPYRNADLIGAWFAAPDPVRFEAFAIALEGRIETEAGIVAGLAFDAVEMARLLGRLAQQDSDGLLREAGFDGVLGPYRFLPSGQCERGLAVLSVAQGATTLIGSSSV